jgi:hypothetical protein
MNMELNTLLSSSTPENFTGKGQEVTLYKPKNTEKELVEEIYKYLLGLTSRKCLPL